MALESRTVTDPVCLMEIDPSEAAAQVEYRGRQFYFCAEKCRQAFEKDPERYAGHGR